MTGASPARVLVVAEEARSVSARSAIESGGYRVRGVRKPADAPDVTSQWQPQLVIVDAQLAHPPPGELISAVRERCPCPCVLLAPAATGDLVTLANQADADAVVVEPIDPTVLSRFLTSGEPSSSARSARTALHLPSVVLGSSSAMRDMWRFVMRAARSNSSVVITGETGVGKEVVARALHRFSARRRLPFVAVNTAALPENLLESELFGHEKGAFTGAVHQRKGRFEVADGGTLFLDEIGDLPAGLQVKLLRILQEQSFERVGGSQSLSVDARVIAATHRDLEEEVARGRFRADLFYRLNVLSIQVPPLRDRKEDLMVLWEHFLEEGAARDGHPPPTTGAEAERLLLRHDWPGNIRELHNVAERALTVARSEITPTDLPDSISRDHAKSSQRDLVGLTMEEIERTAILETYAALGTVKAAARSLGISPRKIHYRLKHYREERLSSSTPSPQAAKEALVEPGASHDTRKKRRVLLAEDDDDLRWALSGFLIGEGFDVIAVPDGNALLERVGAEVLDRQNDPADIIITDIRMPGLTGVELLETVRKRGWTTPVVLISAFGDEATRLKAGSLGATAFLDKPIDTEVLQRVIDGAVS